MRLDWLIVVDDDEILSSLLSDDEGNNVFVLVEGCFIWHLAAQCAKLHFRNPNKIGLIGL